MKYPNPERAMTAAVYPCATCDQPENEHADHCLMHPDNWGREAIPSDIPGTATLNRAAGWIGDRTAARWVSGWSEA